MTTQETADTKGKGCLSLHQYFVSFFHSLLSVVTAFKEEKREKRKKKTRKDKTRLLLLDFSDENSTREG